MKRTLLASALISTALYDKYRWKDNGLDYELVDSPIKKRMPLTQEESEYLFSLSGKEKKTYLRWLKDKYGRE